MSASMSAPVRVERPRPLERAGLARSTQAAPSAVRHCKCGQALKRGVRIGPGSGQRTAVLVCWNCAYEEPSLYGRTQADRNGKYDARRQGHWSYDVDEGTPQWRYS